MRLVWHSFNNFCYIQFASCALEAIGAPLDKIGSAVVAQPGLPLEGVHRIFRACHLMTSTLNNISHRY